MTCNLHSLCTQCTIDAPFTGEGAGYNSLKLQLDIPTDAPCAPFLQYIRTRAHAKRDLISFFTITFYREKGSQGSLRFKSLCFYYWFSCVPFLNNGASMVLYGAFCGKGAGVE